MAGNNIEEICTELQRRVARNQPMDTEQLLGTILVIAESVRALTLVKPATPATEAVPADTPPNVPKTVTRHE